MEDGRTEAFEQRIDLDRRLTATVELLTRVIPGIERLDRGHEALVQRLDSLAGYVQELYGRIDALDALDALDARAKSASAGPGGRSELLTALEERVDQLATAAEHAARTQDDLDQRLDLERAARTDEAPAEGLRSLEKRVAEALARIGDAFDGHKRETEASLRVGLAAAQAAIPAPATASESRLEALEERLEQSDGEMSELGELHAVLDVGLGTLRSEIADVRSAVQKVAGDQADIRDRLADLDRAPKAGTVDQGRGRKAARNAEAGADLAAAIDAAQTLAREHQQLKAQVATLEQAFEAARATKEASAASPLGGDVRLLQEQVAAQNEAIAALSQAVERLRGEDSSDPPTKAARKARKG